MGDMENRMTKTEAINYIRSEMQTVLDDDYPDRMESLVDELVDEGYDEDDAESLSPRFGPEKKKAAQSGGRSGELDGARASDCDHDEVVRREREHLNRLGPARPPAGPRCTSPGSRGCPLLSLPGKGCGVG